MTSSSDQASASAGDRVTALREQLRALGRPDVRIIGVSKTHGPERIVELYQAGLTDFGENRQNEARDKFPLVARTLETGDNVARPLAESPSDPGARAAPIHHHIGPLQSGSARQIPGLFDWVHGVSAVGPSSPLETLQKAADRKLPSGQTINYLIQVALTGEASKAGGMPVDQLRNLDAFPESEALRFRGFMTMGPQSQEPEATREVFHQLRELRDQFLPDGELSMGMSGDWQLAVAEGATMIRVGTALFGPRGAGPWKKQKGSRPDDP